MIDYHLWSSQGSIFVVVYKLIHTRGWYLHVFIRGVGLAQSRNKTGTIQLGTLQFRRLKLDHKQVF